MKKVITAMVAVFFAALAFAQKTKEANVPAIVKEAFKKHFPAAAKVKWEKEDNVYEAGFVMDKMEYSAVLDATGKLQETEVEITTGSLPKAALDYIAAQYPGKKIKEAAKITDAAGTVTYEAEVNKQDLIFNSNGQFIKAVKD